MGDNHCFVSYSTADGLEFTRKLVDELEGGDPFYSAWYDKRDLASGDDWDDQIVEAIKSCKCMLFLMSEDSIKPGSDCKKEIVFALRYKKPIVPLLIQKNVESIFVLGTREWIDFNGEFKAGMGKLHKYLRELDLPEGKLRTLKERLADAEHDLRRAKPEDEPRIRAEIDELKTQIATQEKVVKDPEAAKRQTDVNIQAGMERERQPEKPVAGKTTTKFINPPPGFTPNYFQDRYLETKLIVDFLNNNAQRLLTVVGRAGIGKTAMVCRLLKTLEAGHFPDDLGEHKVEGIVYLGEAGSHKVNFPNIFADLSKLLPPETAIQLEWLYKDPKISVEAKMQALTDAFHDGQVILLLDNFESLIASETQNVSDTELKEAMNAILCGAHHSIKIILTTRIAPRDLNVCEPGRQYILRLDEGLESPHAENMLKGLDTDGKLGIKNAPMDLLALARIRTRGFPRALEALTAILSTDYNTTLNELLENDKGVLPDLVIQKLIGEAFSRLDATAQKVMQVLAVYNRPVIPAAIDYLLQPHLLDVDSAPVLQRLVNMHFARREGSRFYLHPLDREYAFGRIPVVKQHAVERTNSNSKDVTSPQRLDVLLAQLQKRSPNPARYTEFNKYELQERAADFFAQARKPRAEWKKLDDLAAQLAEFDLRREAKDYDAAASVLGEIDFDYLLLWGHYHLMIDLHESLQGKISDKTLARVNVGNLGLANESIGEIRTAIKNFEQVLELARQDNSRQHEGAALGNLGSAYIQLSEARKAVEFFEQALVINREIGNRAGEGADLGNLGSAYDILGEAHKAIEFHEQSLAIDRAIGNRTGEGSSLRSLGSAYAGLGEVYKAIEFYEEALLIDREICNREGEGSDLSGLANCYEFTGQIETAIEYQDLSLAISKEIGDRIGEGSSLSILGSYYSQLNNQVQALKNFEESLEIARQTGYRYGEGFRLLNLARVEIEFGNYQKAIELASLGASIGDDISRPQLQNNSYSVIGLAYLLQGDLAFARKHIEQAQKYDDPINNHNVTGCLGIITLRQGKKATAQDTFTQSITQADELFAKTPDFYDALDAKGLALCGLALCEGKKYIPTAIESFRAARKVAPHAGIIKKVLRLFDELAKCDEKGILKEVRKATEGKE